MKCKCEGAPAACAEAAGLYKPGGARDQDTTRVQIGAPTAEMQPIAAKLPFIHRTPFSVEDILDPRKFTRRIICAAEDATTTGENQTLRPERIQFVDLYQETEDNLPYYSLIHELIYSWISGLF